MGLFLSIDGWPENVPRLLKQNPSKDIMLMEGYDLRSVLSGMCDLGDFLIAKIAQMNSRAEPFLSVQQYLSEQRDPR